MYKEKLEALIKGISEDGRGNKKDELRQIEETVQAFGQYAQEYMKNRRVCSFEKYNQEIVSTDESVIDMEFALKKSAKDIGVNMHRINMLLSLIHISEPTRQESRYRMTSSA